jgi:hypothetical protein
MKRMGIFAVALLLGACSSRSAADGDFREAALWHNKAVALAENLARTLDSLELAKAVPADSMLAWRGAIEAWEGDLIEVPGNESAAHTGHEHHHGHDHEALPDITPAQMLEIQQLLWNRVEQIAARIHAYK